MTSCLAAAVPGRTLLDPRSFSRFSRRLAAEHRLTHDDAEAIMSDALAFLAACATNTGTPLSPSPRVDWGWHLFLLHTHDYAEFCQRIAGRFLHHVPTENADDGIDASVALARTVAAIHAAGYTTDRALWSAPAMACSGCQNGCHDDPPPDSVM
ncbi:hypothetical protein GCM10022247_64590 [Allokutzneria multivorans]|uniref:Uncharacterized protein n=1 Tax=Allokutzneria multivorans TaxID=1142134 RepID=A0ABP7TSZ8_9PSEU